MPHVTMLVKVRAGATYLQRSIRREDCGKRCGLGMWQDSKGVPTTLLAAFSVSTASRTLKRSGRAVSTSKPISKSVRKPGMQSRPLGIAKNANASETNRHCKSSQRVCDTSKKCSSGAICRARAYTLVSAYSQVLSVSFQSLWRQWHHCVCVGSGSNGLLKANNMSRAAHLLVAALVKDSLGLCS